LFINNKFSPSVNGNISCSVVDPGSGDFLTPESKIRDGKISGSEMNIPDNFSDSLETVLTAKNT
jgi:hypothetical protein